jgi:hypothetical protein
MDAMGVHEGNQGMITEEMGYRSFLLRFWCVKQNGELSWRVSLENPGNGQKHFFSSLEALHEFLKNLGEVLEIEMEEKGRS